jgi:hypothetical protein
MSVCFPPQGCYHFFSIKKMVKENYGFSKTFFIVPTDAHCYKIIEMLDMFPFMQEPSSGSSPVLS